jgi:hypothetical protein
MPSARRGGGRARAGRETAAGAALRAAQAGKGQYSELLAREQARRGVEASSSVAAAPQASSLESAPSTNRRSMMDLVKARLAPESRSRIDVSRLVVDQPAQEQDNEMGLG